MRVLLIDVNCQGSSTGKIVYDLYTQLNQDGHEAAICYGRGPLIEGEHIFRFAPQWEVRSHALLTRVTGKTGCYSPVATKRLLDFIEEFHPDVIHIHELHAYFVNIVPLIRYIKKKQIKTIWTFHCEFMYTGKCGYAYECEGWKAQCGNCRYLRDYPKVLWRDCTAEMFAEKKELFEDFENLIITAPSEWLASRVKQSFLSEEDIRVVYNGIDCDVFSPKDTTLLRKKLNLADQKVVLAVAPDLMNERKGGRYVLQLAEQMREDNVKFIMIGIDDLSENFPENVIAMGRTKNQEELAQYYSLADLFVICSRRENFPTTCLEALCCGAPVCGFDTGGTKETAQGIWGEFVEHADVSALVEKVRVSLFEIARKNISVEARGIYCKEKMYQEYLKIYR